MKKSLKIGVSIVSIAFLMAFIFFGYRFWQISTGKIFKVGDVWMTHEVVHEIYVDPNVQVPTSKNTPEEVYTKFREAILVNDIEGALKYIVPQKQAEYKKRFNDPAVLKKYQTIPESEKLIPGKIQNDYWVSYTYVGIENNEKVEYSLDFEMNKDGYWLIDLI